MKVHLKAYGCQMNMRDTDGVAALLTQHGFALTAEERDADIVLVNTCSIRGKAEDKAVGKLRLLVSGRRHHPGRRVGALGCMVQRLQGKLFDSVPGLDLAVGPSALPWLPQHLDLVLSGQGPVLDVRTGEAVTEMLTGHSAAGVSAFVNILAGCDRHCTYCIVPHVRGPEVSRPGPDIVAEVAALIARGQVREVTLLGQSVMSYGRKGPVWPADHRSALGFREPLTCLLEAVSAVPGLARVRFTSGHPSGVTAELARAMAELPKVCAHLHLPVQSGADRILRLMHRGYTADDYRRAVARLRNAVPDIAITTDFIVGFPSETAGEFEASSALMDEIGFDNAFIFKYSPRPGTPAAELADDVPDEEKQRRNQALLTAQDRVGLARNRALVGTVQEVLVEGPSLRQAERWAGRTPGNKIAIFDPTPALRVGELAGVCVTRARAQTLYGDLVAADTAAKE